MAKAHITKSISIAPELWKAIELAAKNSAPPISANKMAGWKLSLAFTEEELADAKQALEMETV